MRVARPSTSMRRRSSASQSWTTIRAPEGARPIGTEEALELAAPRSSREPPGDEHA